VTGTSAAPVRITAVVKSELIWLVYNKASGSNDEAVLAQIEADLSEAGFRIARRTSFPDQYPPSAAELDAQHIATLCIFTGDGSIHTVVPALFGWQGRILVLPGGTMNLLSHQLHGDASPGEIVERIAAGQSRIVRPPVLEGRYGIALTGALAGPGTQWNEVREAMRNSALGEIASAATEAASASIKGERVVCRGLEHVRPEGYAAIAITPIAGGIAANGYYADRLGDYMGQILAMMQGDFRDGPHDDLGTLPSIEIATLNGEPMGLLLDGEPEDGLACESFRIGSCGVDLIATCDEG